MSSSRIMDTLHTHLKLKFSMLQENILRFPQKIHLTQERAVLMAGVVIFSLMGSFVFWGPSKKRKKKIRSSTGVNGLVNMGETCFLNTLLQALASNPIFCEWLTRYQQSELAQALLDIIKHVNGSSESDSPLYPRVVVAALSSQGWTMGVGQQDSHELFFALMSSLEEQTTQITKPHDIMQQLGNEEEPISLDSDFGDISPMTPITYKDSPITEDVVSPTGDKVITTPMSNGCVSEKRRSFMCRVGDEQKEATVPHHKSDFPFRGQQLSQLTCTVCSRASVVQHQAFDCLSLPLPAQGLSTLEMLLSNFTAPEQVHEVQCDHCSAAAAGMPIRNTFVKQLTIGRLPKCLCIHIQRTAWLNDGQAYKRHDYVDFPEILNMDKFTYCHKERVRRVLLQQLQSPAPVVETQEEKKFRSNQELSNTSPSAHDCNTKPSTSTPSSDISSETTGATAAKRVEDKTDEINYTDKEKSICSLSEAKAKLKLDITNVLGNGTKNSLSNGSVKHNMESNDLNKIPVVQVKGRLKLRHNYRLQAVVVHLGEVTSGHFVTFRRPPPSTIHADKWVCTSDETISISSLAEVMRARAYMLFYEKI